MKQEICRKQGFSIQVDEEQLRVQLEAIQAELNHPTQFKVTFTCSLHVLPFPLSPTLTHSLCLSLSVYLLPSLCLFVCPLSLFVCLFIYLSLSLCMTVSQSVSFCLSVCLSPSFFFSGCLSVSCFSVILHMMYTFKSIFGTVCFYYNQDVGSLLIYMH